MQQSTANKQQPLAHVIATACMHPPCYAAHSFIRSWEETKDAASHAMSSASKKADPEREDKSVAQKAKEAVGMD